MRIGLAVALAATLTAVAPSSAHAWTAKSGEWKSLSLSSGGNSFYNYDFTSKSLSASNVDWAVDMIFTNNATVDKISLASGINKKWTYGSVAYGYIYGGWDSSKGLKQYDNGACEKHADNYHFRYYAPSSTDRAYDFKYGYFVIATSHDDYAENCKTGAWTGNSEGAERAIVSIYSDDGYTTYYDDFNLGNKQTNTETKSGQPPHRWDNDGLASRIEIK